MFKNKYLEKSKNTKDTITNEYIYFKSHAKATYISDGTIVEDAIKHGVGGLTWVFLKNRMNQKLIT